MSSKQKAETNYTILRFSGNPSFGVELKHEMLTFTANWLRLNGIIIQEQIKGEKKVFQIKRDSETNKIQFQVFKTFEVEINNVLQPNKAFAIHEFEAAKIFIKNLFEKNKKSLFFSFENIKFSKKKNCDSEKRKFIENEEDKTENMSFAKQKLSDFNAKLNNKIKNNLKNANAVSNFKANIKEKQICTICLEEVTNLTNLDKCIHVFCKQCIEKWMNCSSQCPVCKKESKKMIFKKSDKEMSKRVKKKNYSCQMDEFYDDGVLPLNCSENCMVCNSNEDESVLLICDECDFNVCHTYCIGLERIPESEWFCGECQPNINANIRTNTNIRRTQTHNNQIANAIRNVASVNRRTGPRTDVNSDQLSSSNAREIRAEVSKSIRVKRSNTPVIPAHDRNVTYNLRSKSVVRNKP